MSIELNPNACRGEGKVDRPPSLAVDGKIGSGKDGTKKVDHTKKESLVGGALISKSLTYL